ncbi:Heat shock protein Hsp90 family [Trinorchestia longiramus]|nr:Heat shock protein Hsp90 family [Trinorchestia longiramus]
MKELLKRVEAGETDESTVDIAKMMFRTATLRSGFMLKDTVEFAASVEEMLRSTLGIAADEPIEEEPELPEDEGQEEIDADEDDVSDESAESEEMHDEL